MQTTNVHNNTRSGMLTPGIGQSLASLVRSFGCEKAREMYLTSLAAVKYFKELSDREGMDFGLRWTAQLVVARGRAGSQRVDMTSWGLSIRPNLAAVLDLGPTFAWEFTPEQSRPYYLKARLEIAKDSKQPEAWSGSIVLPESKLPLPFKRTR